MSTNRMPTMRVSGSQAGPPASGRTGSQAGPPASGPDYQAVLEHAGQALADGIAPGSPEGQSVLDRLVPAAERPGVLAQLETFTDARVERYWQLLGVLRGQPPFPPAVPAFEWLIAALRARP